MYTPSTMMTTAPTFMGTAAKAPASGALVLPKVIPAAMTATTSTAPFAFSCLFREHLSIFHMVSLSNIT